jgi:hypothetical protein
MKVSAVEQLRASWTAKGTPSCEHPDTEQERDDQYSWGTGDDVCTTCGAAVDMEKRCQPVK